MAKMESEAINKREPIKMNKKLAKLVCCFRVKANKAMAAITRI